MNINEIKQLDKNFFMNTFGERIPVCFKKGDGIKLYDTEGNVYFDFLAGIAVNSVGHGHPVLKEALISQIESVIHTSNYYYIESQSRLAEKICSKSCANKVFFANSGAEANEGALKLARIYHYKKGNTEKNEIITLKNSFHGRTLATVAATGQEKFSAPYHPLMEKFIYVPINDIEEFKNAVSDKTCAVMMEVIQGESGVHEVFKSYIKEVYEICKQNDIIFIIDEVQTGMGRTGKLFAYEHFGVEPDIFTLAKALGGGVPIGAVCAKDFVADSFAPGDHGSTFGGNPLACSAGLAVFEIFEKEELVRKSFDNGAYFKKKLEELSKKYSLIKEVRGKGLMIGVEFKEAIAGKIKHDLFDKKYLSGATADTLRILPPLTVTKEEIDGFLKAFEEVIKEN